jgi:hypothetical protein
MPKIHYDYFECPEADCPNMDPQGGVPCVIQIAEGERRRCPCERKIKLGEENRVAPPVKEGVIAKKSLIWGGGALILALLLILIFIPKSPVIEIEDGPLRFDPTQIGADHRSRVTVRNVGKGDLNIHSATAEPSIFTVEKGDAPIIVERGETAEITVVFRPVEGAPTEGKLVIASNDRKAGAQEIELIGSVAISPEDALKIFDGLDSTSTVLRPN